MLRALFEKTGSAVWMSHLDLMRLFQRAFKRAGLPLTHTQGYNPRPSVSIALPLSVGVESCCELLDFDLDGATVPCGEIRDRLNAALVEGVRICEVYDGGAKLRDLALLRCEVALEYDAGIPSGAQDAIHQLFAQPEIIVSKKGKNGVTDQNIAPMIRRIRTEEKGNSVKLEALICCQNPTLNPMQLSAAIEKYLPMLKPDFAKCTRLEIYTTNETVFR